MLLCRFSSYHILNVNCQIAPPAIGGGQLLKTPSFGGVFLLLVNLC